MKTHLINSYFKIFYNQQIYLKNWKKIYRNYKTKILIWNYYKIK